MPAAAAAPVLPVVVADGTAKTREAKLLRIGEIARDRKGRVRAVTGRVTQSSAIDSAEAAGGGMSAFAARLRREARRRGALDSEEVVILSDGAKWIESAMRKVFAGLRTTCVRDIFPVLERLQDALKEMVTDGTRRKAAFDRLKDLIRAGNAVLAIAERAPYGRRGPAVAECVRDCRPNLDRMRDDEYRRRGIPCGSGVIKGGCWTVVVDRLKKSGSRWSVDGATGIMAIRCCWMNNRIVDFLQWRAAT